MDQGKLDAAVQLLREKNPKAAILTTPWDQLTGAQILSAMEGGHSLAEELMEEIARTHRRRTSTSTTTTMTTTMSMSTTMTMTTTMITSIDHDTSTTTTTGTSCDACWPAATTTTITTTTATTPTRSSPPGAGRPPGSTAGRSSRTILAALAMGEDYGYILRAKGMVPCDDGQTWLHFDLVPEEFQIREGAADYTGRLCVIGSDLKEDQLEKLFLLA